MGGPESLRLLQYLVDVRSPRESTFSVIRLIAMMNASELWEGGRPREVAALARSGLMVGRSTKHREREGPAKERKWVAIG